VVPLKQFFFLTTFFPVLGNVGEILLLLKPAYNRFYPFGIFSGFSKNRGEFTFPIKPGFLNFLIFLFDTQFPNF